MKTLFKSQDLWDLVENGYADSDSDDEARLKEIKKRDSKALFFIQQAVHESIFSRIMGASTSQEAWKILQKEFQGDKKVIMVKLQSLRREFETSMMKHEESVQDYLFRVSTVVSKMKGLGEQCLDSTVVAKVLRSLTPKFDHVVAAIEESKDLSTFTFDELMGSLLAHEERLNRSSEHEEEKAFHIKGETSTLERITRGDSKQNDLRGRGREEANEEEDDGEDEFKLFMADLELNGTLGDIWFLDSGCSNHMTGIRSLFKELDEDYKLKVRLGDDKQMEVEGKGTIAIRNGAETRLLHEVFFVPSLTQILLSVGQLVTSFSVLFESSKCLIKN
ncbi:uncharacterized protein LOC110608005 [Manihot esculenta]|uniref:uncharacterized protein LOC110608005 n=1 Tax=Manihot esculenta TaxID=3983 RepID=UPI000B5D31E7|nr:uncharacterized protein LOC110608005 [Manihot esculenta]